MKDTIEITPDMIKEAKGYRFRMKLRKLVFVLLDIILVFPPVWLVVENNKSPFWLVFIWLGLVVMNFVLFPFLNRFFKTNYLTILNNECDVKRYLYVNECMQKTTRKLKTKLLLQINQAVAYYQMGEFQESLDTLKPDQINVEQLNPAQYGMYLYIQCVNFTQMKKYEKAQECYNLFVQNMQKVSNNPMIIQNLNHMKEESSRAIHRPEWYTLDGREQLLQDMKLYQQFYNNAHVPLEKTIRAYNLAEIQLILGQLEEAKELYASVADLKTDLFVVKNSEKRLKAVEHLKEGYGFLRPDQESMLEQFLGENENIKRHLKDQAWLIRVVENEVVSAAIITKKQEAYWYTSCESEELQEQFINVLKDFDLDIAF